MTPDIQELRRLAEAADEALRTADGHRTQTEETFLYLYRDAASPSTILALIEAVKRQGEALELVLQNVEASASSYQERVETIGRVVRAALKETTDV